MGKHRIGRPIKVKIIYPESNGSTIIAEAEDEDELAAILAAHTIRVIVNKLMEEGVKPEEIDKKLQEIIEKLDFEVIEIDLS